MRIHRLRLTDFRGIADREVTLPTSGVVVLQGENEVGKTSMIEALDLLLDKPDSSKAREVREAKPVGRDVGPVVEAELSCGPYRFTYTKRWLRETRTELHVAAPRPASFTGAEAHAEVRRILDETLDTSLYQALRVLQASELTSAELGESSALAAALDQAAGTTGHDDDGDALLDAVDAEYATYFTPTGRETGEYATARKELTSAEEASAEAEHQLAQLGRDVDAHARLSTERDELSDRLTQARQDLTTREQAWKHLTGLRERVAEAQARVRAGGREHGWLTEAAERRAGQDRALAAKIAAWEELTRQLAESREQLHTARAEQHSATAAVAAAQAEERRQRDRVEAANRAAERLQDLVELDRVRTTLATIDRAQATIEECEAVLADARIDAELLAAVDQAETELAVSHAQHEAAAARVQVTALAAVDLTVDGAKHSLQAEEEIAAAVTEPVQVELPGTVRISIAPAQSSTDAEGALTAARRRLEELLHQAGVIDRRGAHRRYESDQRTRTELTRARERLEEELAGRSLSELQGDHARLAARITPGAAETPATTDPTTEGTTAGSAADGAAPPDAEPANAESAQAAKDSTLEAHAAAAERSTEATAVQEALTQRAGRLELDCTLLEGKASMAEADINDQRTALAAEREKTPDDELDRAAEQAAAELAEARQAAAAAEAELAETPVEQIEAARTNAVALTERLATEHRDVEERLRRLSVSLELRGEEGLQEAYDTARSAHEGAHSRLQHLDRRARACQLLHETLHRARDSARSRYVRPFREQILALGRIVYGPGFDVDVQDDLTIRSRTLDSVTVRFDQLSAGAREQLAIITRLACAAVVEPDQGVPVIIDDALGYSDPDRLDRMNAMIGSLAADAQVILLTCTPDRYRGIGNASVIRLERSLPATG
ncbi:MAG TPA: AAA family ATPase [Candidatus Ruania gallistercoris]|uniref:AAA family ATPase n=1 Tax=Candidatus Ruania gallistercoris TaxID=2838746 RepID=A0A9D2ECH9_9MICO|nr:AAA family ATPase [Candidatus Ruania gallistercoris]